MQRDSFISIILILFLFFPVFAVSGSGSEKSAARKLYQSMMKEGERAAATLYKKMKNRDSFHFDEQEFLDLGKKMRSYGFVKEAVSFFKMAAELFPQSSNVWQSLGYAQIRYLLKEDALNSYQKALHLDPKNWRAKEQKDMIDTLLKETRNETRAKLEYQPGTSTRLKGPYLGQKSPGQTPELFAPGIVSVYGSNENTVTLTADGKELYFGKEAGIWVTRLTEEGWTAPENTGLKGYEMWISPANQKMYYSGYEPGIWVMDRKNGGWGEPVRLVENGMFSTLTPDETLYTTVFKNGANIGRYLKKDGKYTEPEIFGPEVNHPKAFDAHPNIAPGGDFFVFDSNRPEGTGLYITYRKKDGSWTPARFLGPELKGSVSTFSPDGKYLFFMRTRDIYWVDAAVLEIFRPQNAD